MGIRITDKLVRELPSPPSGNRITYDDPHAGPGRDKGVSGLGIRVTANGVKTFVLNYRVEGRERRMAIGRYPDWSVEAARDKARSLRRKVDDGADPLSARVEKRQAPTIGDLCDLYITEHLPKKREMSAADDRTMIDKIIRKRIGSEKISAIKRTDIKRLHRNMAATPYRANRVLSLLSKMFSLAIETEWCADNPARGIDRFPEVKRERYLNGDEIARLTEALSSYPDQSISNIVRLLLLTGARRGEVLQAQWSQFDLAKGVWVKPAATTKQKKEHRVPLSDGAVALLNDIFEAAPRDDLGRLKNKYVFPGPRSGEPMTEIKDEWRAIALAAGLYEELPPAKPGGKPERKVNCRLHDLRHTYASLLVSAGLSLPIIGALLGHTQASTTHRYAHLMDDPLRAATNQAANLIGNSKRGEVVKLPERVA